MARDPTPKPTIVQSPEADLLREVFPRGSTVYLILRSVSRSGMSRTISPLGLAGRGGYSVDVMDYEYAVAEVLGWPKAKNPEGVKVSGCGMDMGFHLVYTLAHRLYGDGYALTHRWL